MAAAALALLPALCCVEYKAAAPIIPFHIFQDRTVRAALGRSSALSAFLCKSVLYGAFVWAREVRNSQKRRFPARAVPPVRAHLQPQQLQHRRVRGHGRECHFHARPVGLRGVSAVK